jgi:hypothetical protein
MEALKFDEKRVCSEIKWKRVCNYSNYPLLAYFLTIGRGGSSSAHGFCCSGELGRSRKQEKYRRAGSKSPAPKKLIGKTGREWTNFGCLR